MYFHGHATRQNPERAVKLFAKAMTQSVLLPEGAEATGDSRQDAYFMAQFFLATCYMNGDGVAADDTRAVALLQAGAAAAYQPALLALGQCYIDGTAGLKVDHVRGFHL